MFEGIGQCHESLQDVTVPYSVTVARRVPIPLIQKVKKQFDNLTEKEIIEKVIEPTD